MADDILEGSLAEQAFGRLLSRIWETRLTGSLTIHTQETDQVFPFISGDAAATTDTLPASSFGPWLVRAGAAGTPAVKESGITSGDDPASFLKALLQRGQTPPEKIWDCADSFLRSRFKAFFAPVEDRFSFRKTMPPPKEHVLFRLATPELIVEGCRGISDPDLIQKFCPRGEEFIHLRQSPAQMEAAAELRPVEAYVMGLIDGKTTADQLKDRSQLDPADTAKALFLLFNLGIIETRPAVGESNQVGRMTPSDIKALLETLNRQSLAIFRYLSKEIGPVAQTVMDKHIQDAKSHISSLFQPVRLRQGGALDFQPLLKKQALLTRKGVQADLLKGLNEILAAEILAVGNTLGVRAVGPLVDILNKLPSLSSS
jgi:hypothetical protein